MEKWIGWAGFALTLIGFVWHAGRMAERLEHIRRDVDRFEKSVSMKLDRLEAILYSVVGGRRAIRPIEYAEDSPRESQ